MLYHLNQTQNVRRAIHLKEKKIITKLEKLDDGDAKELLTN